MNPVLTPQMEITLFFILAIGLFACAVIDTRHHRIPNAITLPMICLAIAFYSAAAGWEGFFFSLKGCGLGFALFLIPYLLGGMGAGDVKLMIAVGAVIGINGILQAVLYIAVSGGVFALLTIIRRQSLKSFILRHLQSFRDFLATGYYASNTDMTIANKGARFGYGLPIAFGTCLYLSQSLYGTYFP
jgi:prepilin peptidase CpaA